MSPCWLILLFLGPDHMPTPSPGVPAPGFPLLLLPPTLEQRPGQCQAVAPAPGGLRRTGGEQWPSFSA